MNKLKIINDPIYGLIRIPFDFIYDLIENPLFQRLRRIKQMGLSHYVYPGATHTRFSHAIGAMHLTWKTVNFLRLKGVKISDEEALSVLCAVLLHDIGHGPFSHSLEGKFIAVSHEEISLAFMEEINRQNSGALDMAISMFVGDYHRPFFHQLISSQLDMDRLDYLNRDSFFSGVIEGKVGFDRIINMLTVKDESLMIEEKAVFSVEKYLDSRSFMYWQVYMHRASLSAELMLSLAMELILEKGTLGEGSLSYFAKNRDKDIWNTGNREEILNHYSMLDDTDVTICLKRHVEHDEQLISILSHKLLFRDLFKLKFEKEEISSDFLKQCRQKAVEEYKLVERDAERLVILGKESIPSYLKNDQEIQVVMRSGEVVKLSILLENRLRSNASMWYICAPIM